MFNILKQFVSIGILTNHNLNETVKISKNIVRNIIETVKIFVKAVRNDNEMVRRRF